MAQRSDHLEQILKNPWQTAPLRVVLLDIEKYSLRRLGIQAGVVNRFTKCVEKALLEVSRHYIDFAQERSLNFRTDVIKLPTGDGAAVVFPFLELHGIYLLFAKRLLKAVHDENVGAPCEDFDEKGWCDCHYNLKVRVGLSAGVGIIYKDLNGNYNVAGDVINRAARVMGVADGGQILLTSGALKDITDPLPAEGEDTTDVLRGEDAALRNQFILYPKVAVKHGVEIDVHQYRGTGEPYINVETPSFIIKTKKEDIRLLEKSDIWNAVVEMVMSAQERIRVVFLASRPKVPEEVLDAIAHRLNNEVEYEIVLVHRPGDVMELFKINHDTLLEKLRQTGTEGRYLIYKLETNNPICFDALLIDERAVGIGFTRVASSNEIQSAVGFDDKPEIARRFIDWFEHYIKPKAVLLSRL